MEKINMLIEPILSKSSNYDFKSYIKLRKLIKRLKKTSPDYNMMSEIYKFLILLENIYMYGNEEEHYLFSATVPNGYNAAFIYKEKGFNIKFILKDSDQMITIVIDRTLRSKKESRKIEFKNGECIINNKYEEAFFEFIIACLMNGLIELIIYYYKNKKF